MYKQGHLKKRFSRRTTLLPATVLIALLSAGATFAQASTTSLETLQAQFAKGDFKSVSSSLESKNDKTPEEFSLLVSALMNQDLDDAEESAEDFISHYSKDYRAYHMHASVMGAQASNSIFSALGYAEKAKNSLEKAVEVAPEKIEVYLALMQFHLVAPSIAGGDSDEAKRLVDKITEMDTTEGQFARARFLLSEDDEQQAITIYKKLAQESDSNVRASLELGTYYLSEESYDNAFQSLYPLMSHELAPVDKSESAEWQTYQQNKSRLLYGKYRIGLIAVKSGEKTQEGISALQQYLTDLKTTSIDTVDLPSPDWANLRLAELLMNNNELSEAQTTLASISQSGDDRFNNILKTLKKKIKKQI